MWLPRTVVWWLWIHPRARRNGSSRSRTAITLRCAARHIGRRWRLWRGDHLRNAPRTNVLDQRGNRPSQLGLLERTEWLTEDAGGDEDWHRQELYPAVTADRSTRTWSSPARALVRDRAARMEAWDLQATRAPGMRGPANSSGPSIQCLFRVETGHETWAGDSWKNRSGVNVWGYMTVHVARGILYMPFGAPNNDRVGVDRPGDNPFGSSLVAVNAETGRLLWYFQSSSPRHLGHRRGIASHPVRRKTRQRNHSGGRHG